jgi:putative membrane protein
MGGRLPAALSENAREDFNGCVVMHTYVDHSLNPIFAEDTAKELSRLCKNKNLYGKPSAKATQFVEIRKSNVNVIAQKIGDLYIFITSFAPEITEDVSSAIGFNLLDKYKNRAIFIDAHNSFSPDSENEEPVNFGDSKAGRLFSAIDFAKENVDAKKQSAVEFSVEATQKDFMTEGIRSVSVIAYRIAGQKTAIVVLDTNNLVPSFRERIRNRLKSAGFGIVELVTTDAHLVEFLVKKHDQIGLRNTESLEEEIIALAKKALAKLHSAKAAYIFTDLKARVFGEGLFPQIIATGNSLIPFAKFTATALFMAFLFASYLLLQL